MKSLKFLIIVAVTTLSACQTAPTKVSVPSEVTYSGKTHAGAILRADTTNMIQMLVGGQGCNAIEHINMKVFHYEPSNGQKGHVWGKEGWMATGCGKPFAYFVFFTEDGNGGTYFSLKSANR